MSATLSVGIVNPSWTPFRHNTDHVCVMDLANLGRHVDNLHMAFIGSQLQQTWSNVSIATHRVWPTARLPRLVLRPQPNKVQALYQYGQDIKGLRVAASGALPMMCTVGFPSLRHVIARGPDFLEASALAIEHQAGNCARIHFHTDAMRELYLERRPNDAQRSITVPFFLPQLAFIDEAEMHAKFEREDITLLFVGADGQRKGLEELCMALDSIAQGLNYHQVTAVIVSKHPPSCQIFRGVKHLPRVSRNEVQTLMRKAQMYCMVPRHESFGIVFVEAMAAGCAVIADDDLPRQEIFEGGRCGVLLSARQPDALAAAILKLLQDRSAAKALALQGLRRARERYAPVRVAGLYAQAFREMTA